MTTNVENLIKGLPDWNEVINSNQTILANAIDNNSVKIGDLTGLPHTNLADNVKEHSEQLSDMTKGGDLTFIRPE